MFLALQKPESVEKTLIRIHPKFDENNHFWRWWRYWRHMWTITLIALKCLVYLPLAPWASLLWGLQWSDPQALASAPSLPVSGVELPVAPLLLLSSLVFLLMVLEISLSLSWGWPLECFFDLDFLFSSLSVRCGGRVLRSLAAPLEAPSPLPVSVEFGQEVRSSGPGYRWVSWAVRGVKNTRSLM